MYSLFVVQDVNVSLFLYCRRKPELVVFTEMVATSRTYIRGLTLVSHEWLSESQQEYFRYLTPGQKLPTYKYGSTVHSWVADPTGA